MELKTLPAYIKDIDETTRTAVGIFAVHGNLDSYEDVSHPGSFAKTLQEGWPRIKYLWAHDVSLPQIAKINAIQEVGRDALPAVVLQRAPDAPGGVEISRTYFKHPWAEAVFEGIAAGAQDEQSYGYDAVKFDFSELNGRQVRNLREVRLYEVSDVHWGANPATQGSKATLPLDFLLKQLQLHTKAGARHSAADVQLLNAIHRAAVELGCNECKGILEPEDDDAKSRAAVRRTLTQLDQRLRLLSLEVDL